jgi:anti-sigma factor ChrR (cupin superfamily)
MSGLDDDDVDGDLLASLAGALPAGTPDGSLKARLMRSVDELHAQRFAAFVDRVADIADLARAQAQELIDALDDATRWLGHGTALAIFHVDGGPRVKDAIVGFVRMPAGAAFPHHEHIGDEVMLVMQGALIIDGSIHGAGAEVTSTAGSSHGFVAAPGPDVTFLVVAQRGMCIDGNLVTPSDPNF